MNTGLVQGDTVATAVQEEILEGGLNGEASELAAGSVVCLDLTAANGITFKLPTATNLGMPKGVLKEAVKAGAYTSKILRKGLVNAYVMGHASLSAAGGTLQVTAGQRYLSFLATAPTAGVKNQFTIQAAYTTTSEALKSVYVDI